MDTADGGLRQTQATQQFTQTQAAGGEINHYFKYIWLVNVYDQKETK